MKSDIKYYYNLDIDTITDIGEYHIFDIGLDRYYFCLVKRPLEDFEDLIRVNIELENKNIKVHKFIPNRDKKYITKIGEQNYVLLKIMVKEDEELDLFDIEKIQNLLVLNDQKSKLYRNNWGRLWSEKVDYFEYQISQLGKDKEIILNSFSYYIGLAENAISYINNVTENYKGEFKLTLSHKRIYYPNYALNYYNPLSFVFDQRVRDISSYVKSAFFEGIDTLSELETYFKHNNLSNYEFRLFYARMLYPSYYFDLYEQVMNNGKEEKELLKIIDKVDEYEKFLNDIYLLITKFTIIDKIDWIGIKKEA